MMYLGSVKEIQGEGHELTEEARRKRLGVLDSLELGVLAPLWGPNTASSHALLSCERKLFSH